MLLVTFHSTNFIVLLSIFTSGIFPLPVPKIINNMERTIVKTRIPFVISIFNLNPFLNILIAIVNIEKAITTHTNKVKKEYN